jgi:hypothetical protein
MIEYTISELIKMIFEFFRIKGGSGERNPYYRFQKSIALNEQQLLAIPQYISKQALQLECFIFNDIVK